MSVWLLIIEAFLVYALVLGVHALRRLVGHTQFYAMMGGLTAVMSWVTDAGVHVEAMGMMFNVGSTVFYTALLLGVFVVYVFDGPRATRVAISTVAGISIMVPLVALVLHLQMHMMGSPSLPSVPVPSLRINASSVVATLLDLVFLAIAWEFLNNKTNRFLGLRVFLTLLGVMWLDVILFTTGAFLGTDAYWEIMGGTMLTRLVICLFATPLLWLYLAWQGRMPDSRIEPRPVLAILRELGRMEAELSRARTEVRRRMVAEKALQQSERRYRQVVENANEAIVVIQDGMCKWFNNRASEISGYSRAELGQMEYLNLIHPEDQLALFERQERWRSGHPVDPSEHFRVVTATGKVLWMEANPVTIDWEGRPATLNFMTDITTRKTTEEEKAKLISELEQARDELRAMALLDGLTGAANRRSFDEMLEKEWQRARRDQAPLGLIMVDIDLFKAYNDTYGHQAGDDCLRTISQTLASTLKRPGDFMARYGGEEFVVLLPGTDMEGAERVAEELRLAVELLGIEHASSDVASHVTISAGTSCSLPGPCPEPCDLLSAADQALYAAKHLGRNQVAMQICDKPGADCTG